MKRAGKDALARLGGDRQTVRALHLQVHHREVCEREDGGEEEKTHVKID